MLSGRETKHAILLLVVALVALAACADSSGGSTGAKIEDSGLLFGDEFGPENGPWLIEGDEFGSTAIEDGRMLIDVAQANSLQFTTLDEPEFTDFDLSVETQLIDGGREATYGVLFRMASPEEFYRFEMTGDGRYVVERRELDGSWQRLVNGWQKSDVLATGTGAINNLRITAVGPVLTFYANDEMLQELQDSRYPAGKIALDAGTFGQQRTVVAFDNLAVRSP